MANRRMFSLSVVDTDGFIDMPATSRLLYYELGVRADDDGFVQPNKIIRMLGLSSDDLKVLVTKNFVIPFDSGVVVITNWNENNFIRSDRYKETRYIEEKSQLNQSTNGVYTRVDGLSKTVTISGIPNDNQRDTQVRLGKVSIGKRESTLTRSQFVSHKDEILQEATTLYPYKDCIKAITEFIERTEIKDYKYKNYKLAFFKWVRDDKYNQYAKAKEISHYYPEEIEAPIIPVDPKIKAEQRAQMMRSGILKKV